MALSDYLGKFWATSEPMFGVIMVICFTSILRINEQLSILIVDRVAVAALTCCIAWGLVDGIFYSWEAHYIQNKKNSMINLVKGDLAEKGRSNINVEMDDTLLAYLDKDDRDQVIGKISKKMSQEAPEKVPIRDDVITIGGSLLLVVGSAVIVLLPFYFITDVSNALLVSNVLCITIFFILGYIRNESKIRLQKVRTGILTALLGVIITLVTVLLGG
jgi:hypothetical protein